MKVFVLFFLFYQLLFFKKIVFEIFQEYQNDHDYSDSSLDHQNDLNILFTDSQKSIHEGEEDR